ncbi:MAG: glycosyltransferase [Candidatus Bathyarchaeota archaeon]|nr:glycosyltransferase [Candidatus Bathyarchaeota archaeon]
MGTNHRKYKIAMLSVHTCPIKRPGGKDTGGMNVYVRELAKDMGQKGHFVDVYTRAHDPEENKTVNLGPNSRLVHIKAGEIAEIDKATIYPNLHNFARNMRDFVETRNLQYDLIHSHYWMSGCVGDLIQSRMSVPHITMFHTLGHIKNLIKVGENEPNFRIKAEKNLVKNCNRIVASTDMEKSQLIDFYGASPETISVVPCGVNLDLFKPMNKGFARQELQLDDDEHVILFVGRIVPLKGIENLLKAMKYLSNKKIKLVVVGGDDYSRLEVKRLKRLSYQLQVHKSVIFLSSMEQKILPYFYSASDVCVIPSFYESFGLVALESLACGTPVITTDVGCMKSVINEPKTGYIISNNTPHNLANKISYLLKKPNADSHSIRESITRFSWSNIAETIINEYDSITKTNFNR